MVLSIRRSIWPLLLLSICTAFPTGLRADNWPQWRGPKHDGISHEVGIPTTWSKTENVAWRLPLPGPAGSTPVVWQDHIFLTSAEGPDLVLIAANTNGKQLWKQTLGTGDKKARGDEGNLASPSPATDGEHVWAFVGTGDLHCYDFAGKLVWKANIQERYGKFEIQFGMSSTPVLDGDRLYLQLIHGEGNPKTREALVLALDKATGKEVWKQPRPSEAHTENEHSYASPTIYRDDKQAYLLTHGADYTIAHSLEDGHELWRCGGHHDEKYNPTLRLVASPVAVPGLIIAPSAKNGPVLAISPDAKGDITDSTKYRLWTREHNTPDVSSPLVYDGIVYLCRENGNLLTLDAKTGAEIYEKTTHRDRHRASPVYADGKIYLSSRDGTISVIKTGREFEMLSQNKMEEDISASPAISNGRIYLRTFESLIAIGEKK
ncbi:MAG TPA: PQQ-binding-like beta-propeller repeat protein [Planctomycetaceae bacterium]|nr:PQQ-binding-like beta-propeller repeat protein [Planctomycetaceae bacterium]